MADRTEQPKALILFSQEMTLQRYLYVNTKRLTLSLRGRACGEAEEAPVWQKTPGEPSPERTWRSEEGELFVFGDAPFLQCVHAYEGSMACLGIAWDLQVCWANIWVLMITEPGSKGRIY